MTTHDPTSRKTLVLGLDGATFDVLDPLIEDARLPNIKALIDDGFRTPLQSTYPPITGPAWTALATGLGPGNTGAYDFMNRTDPDSFDLSFIDSSYVSGQSFWDYLSADNTSVGILNYPMLFPPYEVDGFMISGLGAETSQQITYPPSLHDELDVATGEYMIKMPTYMDPVYKDNEEKFLAELHEMLDVRLAATEYLMTEKEWDMFTVIFSVSDLMQHYLWKHWDPNHPDHQPGRSETYREEFIAVWECLDDAVGQLVDNAGDDTNVLVLSDHGFGPQYGCFNVNAWLEREGFLSCNDVTDQSFLSVAEETVEPILERISSRGYTYLRRFIANRLGVSRPSIMDRIDQSQTTAVSLGSNHNVAPIYIIDIDRRGTVIGELLDAIRGLNESGELPHTIEVTRGDEVYSGEKTALAPDVLVHVASYEAAVDKRLLSGNIYRDEAYSPNQTGLHRENGILVGSGPAFTASEVSLDPDLVDIAPTLLYLQGLDPGNGFDGNVLDPIFTNEFHDVHPGTPLPAIDRTDSGPNDGQDEQVREQLEDLGYL